MTFDVTRDKLYIQDVTGSIIRGNGSTKVMGAVMAADETVAEGGADGRAHSVRA